MTEQEEIEKLKREMESKKVEIEGDLRKIEKYIMEYESRYLENTEKCGNLLQIIIFR